MKWIPAPYTIYGFAALFFGVLALRTDSLVCAVLAVALLVARHTEMSVLSTLMANGKRRLW